MNLQEISSPFKIKLILDDKTRGGADLGAEVTFSPAKVEGGLIKRIFPPEKNLKEIMNDLADLEDGLAFTRGVMNEPAKDNSWNALIAFALEGLARQHFFDTEGAGG